jgi:D-alanyl-D-alanine endopeptidase (penicillin-binding protein 7)
VLPIASLTKLMTGLIISEARLPMDEMIVITQDDVDTEKGSRSRLRVGTELSRGELMHLALMSSENRAAHALGRTYPGGMATFVALMNARAKSLGMTDTRYVEPTGCPAEPVQRPGPGHPGQRGLRRPDAARAVHLAAP